MNELERITVTVTRIMYGFDESELEKEGVNEYTIKGERTIVEMDGEIYYDQYAAAHLKKKRPLFSSPVDCFWNYIVMLFPEEKPNCCGNIGCDVCNRLHLMRKRRFEVLNFKKQLFNVSLKKFLLGFKSSFGKKFRCFKM